MFRARDIRSLSDFRRHAKEHLDRLEDEGAIEILTVNGEARGVVMSPSTFDGLAEKVREAELTSMLLRGLADVESGRTRPAEEVLRELATKHGLRLDR